MPNKIKAFICRECHGILPTRTRLFDRGISSYYKCVLCSDAAELLNHVLWDCPFGMQELIVASYNAVLLNLFEVGLVVEEIRNMAFVGPYLI